MEFTELMFALVTAVGLSAACGFRIFVPLLVMNLAARSGHLSMVDGFEWMSSTTALVVFSGATLLEVGAYYLPFLDNLLDTLTTPTAVVAGTVVTASQVGDMSPLLTWSLAAVVGGGSAGLVQGLTTAVRSVSSFATAGFGNPLVSTAEAGASIFVTILAVVVPFVAVFLVLALLFYAAKKVFFRKKTELPEQPIAA